MQQHRASEHSYVDLPIVGSGGSSVGGELVGWLRGVWPHNHSHNDSLSLSLSMSVSLFLSLSLALPSFYLQVLLSFHRGTFRSFSSEAALRLALTDDQAHEQPWLITIASSLALPPPLFLSLSLFRPRSRGSGRDTRRCVHATGATKQAHRRPITMASPPKRFIVIGVPSAHASMRTNHCLSSNGRPSDRPPTMSGNIFTSGVVFTRREFPHDRPPTTN